MRITCAVFQMNGLLEYKGYLGTVEYSSADKVLFGKLIGIKSLISYEGGSVEQLEADFRSAVDDYLDTCAENGVVPEKPCKGSFNVRIRPELHTQLVIYSQSHKQTLNHTVEEAIANYLSV